MSLSEVASDSTTKALLLAVDLVTDIQIKRRTALCTKIKPKPRRSIHASSIPDCARQGVYEFSNWQDKKLWGPETQALMNAGHVQESAYKAELRELGYELVEDQAPLAKDMGDRYGIHGYIDSKIVWAGTRIPVEFKAINPNTFARIRDGIDGIEDMRAVPYMRKYIRQGLVYMIGNNEEAMIFALTDSRGAWKFVPMALDFEEAERVLKIAETIKGHVESKTLPDRIPYDNEICGWCSFQHVCLPDIKNDPTVKFIDNPQVEKDLNRLEELKAAAKEYDAIYDRVKETFAGSETAAVGDWIVTNKIGTTTRYEVPDDVKRQYATKIPTSRMKIERLGKPTQEVA